MAARPMCVRCCVDRSIDRSIQSQGSFAPRLQHHHPHHHQPKHPKRSINPIHPRIPDHPHHHFHHHLIRDRHARRKEASEAVRAVPATGSEQASRSTGSKQAAVMVRTSRSSQPNVMCQQRARRVPAACHQPNRLPRAGSTKEPLPFRTEPNPQPTSRIHHAHPSPRPHMLPTPT